LLLADWDKPNGKQTIVRRSRRVMDALGKPQRLGTRWFRLAVRRANVVEAARFTLIAVVTTLGIGANTAIFSVVNGACQAPFPDSERSSLSETSKEVPVMSVAFPNYLDWQAQQTVFEDLAARMPAGGVITGGTEPLRVIGRLVTASFFSTLGVKPHIGRFFSDEEDRPGAER
jgi:hypothetical protein